VCGTGVSGQSSFGTVAYSSATGRQIWARRYQHFGRYFVSALAIAVSPATGTVYVTGTDASRDFVAVGYAG
jgi:outer membrane protein assembly factor BamB